MAQSGQTYEAERRETVDPSSNSGQRTAGGGHVSGYLGLAIIGMILVLMLFLQNSLAANL
jgi:hypothetical protein